MMKIFAKLVLFSMCSSIFGETGVSEDRKSEKSWSYSGCPASYYHYPHHENGYPVCAYWWDGEGDDWPVAACNGDRHYTGVGDYNLGYYPMGSIYVMPGCTMYLWEGSMFSGAREKIYYGLLPNNPNFASNGAIPGPQSWKCRCDYPITCVPEDGFEVILQYDNRKGKTPITLKYTKTIGISLSVEVQQSFSVTNTTTATVAVRLHKIFASLQKSQKTKYDWSVKVAADFSVTTSLESEITILPGKSIQLLQAVGKCGDSEVRTSLFKVKTLKDYD